MAYRALVGGIERLTDSESAELRRILGIIQDSYRVGEYPTGEIGVSLRQVDAWAAMDDAWEKHTSAAPRRGLRARRPAEILRTLVDEFA